MYICLYYEIKTWGIINYAFQHNTIFNFFSPLLVRTIDWFGQKQSQIYVIRINSLIYLLLINFLCISSVFCLKSNTFMIDLRKCSLSNVNLRLFLKGVKWRALKVTCTYLCTLFIFRIWICMQISEVELYLSPRPTNLICTR